jgi:hypothetical protein
VPRPNDPTSPEFYVYRLEASGVPFYVGLGRSKRASDRVRYVRSQMVREDQGDTVKWDLSCKVVAELLRAGCDVTVAYAAKGLVRAEAATQEIAEISRLLSSGVVLANIHHNANSPQAAADVVKAVVDRIRAAAEPGATAD